MVTTSGPAATVPARTRLALLPNPSVTVMVAEKLPDVVGVPVIAPVPGSRVSPAGRLPDGSVAFVRPGWVRALPDATHCLWRYLGLEG